MPDRELQGAESCVNCYANTTSHVHPHAYVAGIACKALTMGMALPQLQQGQESLNRAMADAWDRHTTASDASEPMPTHTAMSSAADLSELQAPFSAR